MAIWIFGKLDSKTLFHSFCWSLQIYYSKYMARFINTWAQNTESYEMQSNNFLYLKKEWKKSLTPDKHFAGVSTKVWYYMLIYTGFWRKYAKLLQLFIYCLNQWSLLNPFVCFIQVCIIIATYVFIFLHLFRDMRLLTNSKQNIFI